VLATAFLIVAHFLNVICNDHIDSKTIIFSYPLSFQYIIKKRERRVKARRRI
jgi:hypothetical protein